MFNGFFYWRLINMGINRKQKHASIRGFAFRRLKFFSIIHLILGTNSDNSSSDNSSSDDLKICKKSCKPVSRILFSLRSPHHLSSCRITPDTLAAYPPASGEQPLPFPFGSGYRYTWHFNPRGLSLMYVSIHSVRSYRTFSPLPRYEYRGGNFL